MRDRVWVSSGGARLAALSLAALASLACNPDPGGQCNADSDCASVPGTTCNTADHLCEVGPFCTSACAGDTVCSAGVCEPPYAPEVRLYIGGNPILSPANDVVQVGIFLPDPSVTLGMLHLRATRATDGGLLASADVQAAEGDAGVVLLFDPPLQGKGNLVALVDYSAGGDAGLPANSVTDEVRVDAVPPTLALAPQPGPDGGNGWFPRQDGGSLFIDALLDDTSDGSGPDGGTLTILSCASSPACQFAGVLQGSIDADAGTGTWRFIVPLTVGDGGSESPIAYSVEGVDNAGNQVDQQGQLLIDGKPPVTDSVITIVTAGASGADGGGPWFPAGTSGEDVEIALGASDEGSGLDPASFILTFNSADIDPGQPATVPGFLPSPPDGRVHFKVPTGRTSNRQGPLRFSIALADNVGNAAAPVAGELLVDNLAPTTDAQITIVNRLIPDSTDWAGTTGEDGQLWFPAGSRYGLDIEVNLAASDPGSGLNPGSFLLTFNSADIDAGQPLTAAGAFASPPDGRVHFEVDTKEASNREGPLRFTLAIADEVGNTATVAGELLIDDFPPQVSLATVDYRSTIQPARSAVCANSVSCGRGALGAEDHALRDDTVTATFTAVDCGSGVNTAAEPAVDCTNCGHAVTFPLNATLSGTSAGNCSNGSTDHLYTYTVQIPLGTFAQTISSDASGLGEAALLQVVVDNKSSQGFSPTPTSLADGGIISISRTRWRAILGGLATGAPALLPLSATQDAGTPRTLVVPVDGSGTPAAPDALELFDSTGAEVQQIPLLSDAGVYDHATGDVAVSNSGTIWISGSPASCDLGLSFCTSLWAARLGSSSVATTSCPAEGGVIGSLAVRDSNDGGVDAVVIVVSDAGLTSTEAAAAYEWRADAPGCSYLAGTTRTGVSAATGVALGGGLLFVSSSQGFYSIPFNASGQLSANKEEAFADSSSGALVALPAAPALLSGGSVGPELPYFGAVDSLSSPSAAALREAVLGSSAWGPEAAPWGSIAIGTPVTHTPVFDGTWLYTVDDHGALQLTSLAASGGAVTALSAPALAGGVVASGSSAAGQKVSAPVLMQGGSAGSSALLVQGNGLVTLASVVASSAGAPTLVLAQETEIGDFAAGARPPTPVVDVRGSTGVAYLIDGASCAGATSSCGPASVWAFQLDTAPVAAAENVWPRPGHDSCNSRSAEGSCP